MNSHKQIEKLKVQKSKWVKGTVGNNQIYVKFSNDSQERFNSENSISQEAEDETFSKYLKNQLLELLNKEDLRKDLYDQLKYDYKNNCLVFKNK